MNVRPDSPELERLENPRINKMRILNKCDDFATIGIWPKKSRLNPDLWLNNFEPEDEKFALCLLNAFLFYSDEMVSEVFNAAIKTLARSFTEFEWDSLQNDTETIVTYVTGENPNPTDSGHLFTRYARHLGFDEHQILTPSLALQSLDNGFSGLVLFVDDFLQSGNQFIETWKRIEPVSGRSFSRLIPKQGANCYYTPAFATQYGIERLKVECPIVEVNAGNVLTDAYRANSPVSWVWPEELRSSGVEFIERVSKQAGINHHFGFADLALTIAFDHTIPDATLPIFWWDKNGWFPLIKL